MPPLALRSLRHFGPRFVASKTRSIALLSALAFGASMAAQSSSSSAIGVHAPADRLTQPIVESNRVVLAGTVHPLANNANDRGAVADGMKLDRIQIVLKRSDAQESALKQLIGDMHRPGSASYHKWLTPDEFGKQFGPSDADVAKLESWLGSHGFSVTRLNPGRQTLEIAGTAGQFRDTFHAQIHKYQVKGGTGGVETGSFETHFANASAPEIPAAVAPVFGGFASLNNFRWKSQAHVLGKAQYNTTTHESKPEWTYVNGENLLLGPGDLAVQYDLNPLYSAGTNGTGQSIAIVNDSNINVAQVNNYRALFGLPVNPPQVIIDGNDPGIDAINSPYGPNGDSFEAYLDVELAGAVAPDAQINLVIADSTALEDGLALAAQRAVYSNISPVLSLSFGECEAGLQFNNQNAFWSSLWEQAAAQGITVLVSTGDAGSAGCDNDNTQDFAVFGQAVNGFASTPYNVAVGGTDFYYSGGSVDLAKYWNLTPTNSTPTVSLLSKVPEQPFNTSQYGLNLFDYYSETGDMDTSIFAASGGASTAGLLISGNTYGPYPKPSWQTGAGVPNDHARDIPDVSLFGALDSSASYTPICAEDGDCEPVAAGSTVQISGVGGTSVAAPSFAGMMALVNQKYGRQGQANYVLYPLATQFPSVFNDVTAGNNSVPCAIDTVFDSDNNNVAIAPNDCQAVSNPLTVTDTEFGSSVEGQIGFAANTPAYSATAGYDLASGLGSVDANNLVTNWGSVKFAATATTLTPSATSFAHGTAITVSGTVTGSSPSGDVALVTTSTNPNQQGLGFFTLSGGAYSGSVSTLPGGTYSISGSYGGDGANAASTSAPVSITVTPEASTTALTVYSSLTTSTGNPLPASGGSVSYGQPVTLSAQATSSSGSAGGIPTGSVIFSDGPTAVTTAVVNVEGDAEFNASPAPGAHSFTAKYSGDSSYGASTSAATSFTVTKNTPNIYTIVPLIDQNKNALNGATYYLTVQVENSSSSNAFGHAPTGTITVSGAPSGTPPSATLVPAVNPYNKAPEGTAVFAIPATASGSYNLTFSYAGDANYTAATLSQGLTFDTATGLPSTVTATASATATSPNAAVPVTVTITGQTGHAAPTGTLLLITSGYLVAQASLASGVTTGDSVTVSFNLASAGLFQGTQLFQGTNQITAQYYGDSTYNASATVLTILNPLSDFSLVPATTILSVPSTGVQTDTINLSSYNGFSGAVGLTCTASGGVTCSLGSSSVTLASGGTAATTVSVNTSAVTAAGTYSVVVTGTDSTGHSIHNIGLQVVVAAASASTAPGFTLAAGPAITIATQGQSATSSVTIAHASGGPVTVNLTCAVTTAVSGAIDLPTCSFATTSVTVSDTTTVLSVLTVNTTAQTTGRLNLPLKGFFTAGGSAALAAILFFAMPLGGEGRRRRRTLQGLRIFSLALLAVLLAGAGAGCGGGSNGGSSNGGGGGTSSGGTTTGSYTVTVTATPTSGTAQTATIGVTVN